MLLSNFYPKKWKSKLVFIYITSLFLTVNLTANTPNDCINCFSTEIIDYTTDENCITIQLKVSSSSECKYALSHYSVEIPCGQVSQISNSEDWKIENPSTDPTSGISGFKTDDIQGFGEDKTGGSFTVSYTICTSDENCLNLIKDGFKVAYKASTCVFYEDIKFAQQFSAQLIPSNISCFGGNNGSIAVEVNEGVAPYSYLWSNGATSDAISNLRAGQYSVIVTDANGSSVELETTLSQPSAALTGEAVIIPASCANNDGSLTVNVSGGTAPYQYYWNNGKTSNILENIYAGNYTLQIIDANGCSIRKTFEVNEDIDLEVNLKPNFLECHEEGEGTVESIVSGGVEPYSYEWSNQDTSANISQVNSGRYSLTVTDANGCNATASTYIGIKKMMLSTSVINPTCFGGSDGEISISDVTYGSEPYTYLWNTGDTIAKLSNVESGRYKVTVTDANGCITNRTINVAGRPEIKINHSIVRSDCSSDNISAEIDLSISGGTPSYAIYLNDELINLPLTVTEAGEYTFTIIDALGCEKTHTVNINNVSSNITLTANIAQPACGGEQTGSVELIASGGLAPYRFTWSDGSILQNRNNIPSGNYLVDVIDDNGCSSSTEVIINTVSNVDAKITYIPPFTCDSENIVIKASSVGLGEYTWEIINNDSYYITSENSIQMTFNAGTGDAEVVYSVINGEGCFASDTVIINCGTNNGGSETPTDTVPDYNGDCFSSVVDKITHLDDNCYLFEMWVHTNGECAHELSHLSIGLDNGTVVSAENSRNWKMEVNSTDPKTGIYGLKVDDISNFGQNGNDKFKVTFEVCFNSDNDNYFPEQIIVAYKAANHFTTQVIALSNDSKNDSGIYTNVYPNPFIEEGTLHVRSKSDTNANIVVYDIYGNLVQNIFKGHLKAGVNYTFSITGGSSHENIFFYKILTPNKVVHGKVLKAN